MHNHKVLVIEDEEDLRDGLKQVLELEGFNVLTASNGQEGLDILKREKDPCLIVLDIMMPILNGWEFLERFKSSMPDISKTTPVVVVSALAEASARAHREASAYLKKPLDIHTFLNVVKSYC